MLKFLSAVFVFVILLSGCGRQDARESSREELNPPSSAYTQVIPCGPEDTSCQTLLDMYERKPGFKEQLLVTLEQSGLGRPLWLDKALSTRLIHTNFREVPLLIGRTCEPRNCAQVLYVAYDAAAPRVFGFYRTNERVQWFGNPDDGEKARLCEEEPVCALEPQISELPQVLTRWSFPMLTQSVEFANCTEYKGGITSKDGMVCSEQFVTACPYGSAGCTATGQFVGEQPAGLSFKYKTRNVKYDELKKALDKAYGPADSVVVPPDAAGGAASWISVWKDRRVEITLRRVKGVNALGERYDDTWLSFSDKAFALFN